jgi:hypothetical protein
MAITPEDLNTLARLASQGSPFAQQFKSLGFSGPTMTSTGRQEERYVGSDNPTMVDIMAATPEFSKFVQEQGLGLSTKDMGFGTSDITLTQGTNPLETYSSRLSGFEKAMAPLTDYVAPAFLAYLGAQAIGGLSGMGSAAGAGTTPGTIPMGAETLAPVSTAVPTAVAPASIIEGSALVTGAGAGAGAAAPAALGGASAVGPGVSLAGGPSSMFAGSSLLSTPASMMSAPAGAAARAGLTFGQQMALSSIPAAASQIAARQQASGAREAARIAAEARAPYTRAAEQALGTLSSGIAPGGPFAQRYDYGTPRAAQLAAEEAARRNIEQSAASRGGLLTSNTLDQIQRESARIGASYQNQDFNQWLAEQQLLMKPLETMVGMGSQQISQVADIGSTAAMAAAGSRAGATLQTANLLTSGLSRAMNQEDVMRRLQEILGVGGGPGRFSDERLKSGIRRVGTTDDGLPVYVYRMGDGPTQMGVMAQEVEEREPDAVSTHSSGYKMVDYDRVS